MMDSVLGVAMNTLCSGSPIVIKKNNNNINIEEKSIKMSTSIRKDDRNMEESMIVYRWILTMHRIWQWTCTNWTLWYATTVIAQTMR